MYKNIIVKKINFANNKYGEKYPKESGLHLKMTSQCLFGAADIE